MAVEKSIELNKAHPEIKLEVGNFFPVTTRFNQKLLDDFTEKVMLHDSKDPLYIYFDSPGGSVFAVSRMIGILKSSDIKTICVARYAASAAFMLFEYCHARYILPDGILMSHNWAGTFSNEAPRIKTLFEVVDRIVENIDKPIAKRMKLDFKEYKRLINNNLWMDVQYAEKYNAIDGVVHKLTCSKSLLKKRIKSTTRGYFRSKITYKSGCPLITKTYNKPAQSDEY